MELLIVFGIGCFIGYHYACLKMAKELKDAADELGIDLEKAIEKYEAKVDEPKENKIHKLIVERHGEMLYLFDREKDKFICQASSVQELAKLAKDYQNITLATAIHDSKVFMFKDGKSEEYKE